jgi:hypothetical protein
MKRRKVSYVIIYVSHAGRDGLPSHGFHAVALKSLSQVLLSLADREVSIKQECCVKKVITVGVQSGAGAVDRGRTDGWCSSRIFPGFPFLRGHEVEESINTEGPPSFHPKRNFIR